MRVTVTMMMIALVISYVEQTTVPNLHLMRELIVAMTQHQQPLQHNQLPLRVKISDVWFEYYQTYLLK